MEYISRYSCVDIVVTLGFYTYLRSSFAGSLEKVCLSVPLSTQVKSLGLFAEPWKVLILS